MELKKVNVSELHYAERNVRKHPQKQIEELRRSYSMFGQYRPLVIASDGEVLIGNGLLEALIAEGVNEVSAYILPEGTTEDYKRKLMLADNKIYELGGGDLTNIDWQLANLGDFDIPGFDASVLTELYSNIDEEPSFDSQAVRDKIEDIKATEQKRIDMPPKDDESKYVVKEEAKAQQVVGGTYITCPHCGLKIYGVR